MGRQFLAQVYLCQRGPLGSADHQWSRLSFHSYLFRFPLLWPVLLGPGCFAADPSGGRSFPILRFVGLFVDLLEVLLLPPCSFNVGRGRMAALSPLGPASTDLGAVGDGPIRP